MCTDFVCSVLLVGFAFVGPNSRLAVHKLLTFKCWKFYIAANYFTGFLKSSSVRKNYSVDFLSSDGE